MLDALVLDVRQITQMFRSEVDGPARLLSLEARNGRFEARLAAIPNPVDARDLAANARAVLRRHCWPLLGHETLT